MERSQETKTQCCVRWVKRTMWRTLAVAIREVNNDLTAHYIKYLIFEYYLDIIKGVKVGWNLWTNMQWASSVGALNCFNSEKNSYELCGIVQSGPDICATSGWSLRVWNLDAREYKRFQDNLDKTDPLKGQFFNSNNLYCAGLPGIYARVTKYLSWIEKAKNNWNKIRNSGHVIMTDMVTGSFIINQQ